jgi:phosphoribosyl 1,2-cyclic phosphodiesterase
MMKITPLASGSSGNSFLIQKNGCSILLDAGLSGKQMEERLNVVGADPACLSGIVVSHGHSDHVKGVGVLSRRYHLPVYMNHGTWSESSMIIKELHDLTIFETGKPFALDCFNIYPFSVPHDSADPVGFRIKSGKEGLGIATDLGIATGLVATVLTGLQVVVVESNHDPAMLRDGPYPWELKQRVKSRLGHLSNQQSAKLLQQIVSDSLKVIILAHMSQTNNRPDLAMDCAAEALGDFIERNGTIGCANQDKVGPSVEW